MVRIPNSLANISVVEPMPLVPPCTSSVLPEAMSPRWKTLAQTVKKVSGMAAAVTASTLLGTGSAWVAGTTQYSA